MKWISIKDRFPDHNQFVLGAGRNETIELLRCDSHTNYVFMSVDLTHQITGITHWIPIPPIADFGDNGYILDQPLPKPDGKSVFLEKLEMIKLLIDVDNLKRRVSSLEETTTSMSP